MWRESPPVPSMVRHIDADCTVIATLGKSAKAISIRPHLARGAAFLS